MGQRQRQWASRARLALIEALGGHCRKCGWFLPEDLQFDHIDPETKQWVSSSMESAQRICLYRREAKAGLLQLLCKECHDKKTALENRQRALDPF